MKFLCLLFTHDIQQIVWFSRDPYSGDYMCFCHRCGQWLSCPRGRVPGKVLGVFPREWFYEDPTWPR